MSNAPNQEGRLYRAGLIGNASYKTVVIDVARFNIGCTSVFILKGLLFEEMFWYRYWELRFGKGRITSIHVLSYKYVERGEVLEFEEAEKIKDRCCPYNFFVFYILKNLQNIEASIIQIIRK